MAKKRVTKRKIEKKQYTKIKFLETKINKYPMWLLRLIIILFMVFIVVPVIIIIGISIIPQETQTPTSSTTTNSDSYRDQYNDLTKYDEAGLCLGHTYATSFPTEYAELEATLLDHGRRLHAMDSIAFNSTNGMTFEERDFLWDSGYLDLLSEGRNIYANIFSDAIFLCVNDFTHSLETYHTPRLNDFNDRLEEMLQNPEIKRITNKYLK